VGDRIGWTADISGRAAPVGGLADRSTGSKDRERIPCFGYEADNIAAHV